MSRADPTKKLRPAASTGLPALLVCLLVAVFAVVPSVNASEPQTSADAGLPDEQDEAYRRLVSELMSPFCRGLVLKDCPSSGAARMREQVREWVREGRSDEWITERLAEQYGEIVRGSPEFTGFGIVAWLAPFVALAGGLIILVTFLRGRGGAGAGASASSRAETRAEAAPADRNDVAGGADADTETIRRRVEAELEELDQE